MLGHPKLRRLGNERYAALGFWTACGMWCVANSADGFIPREEVLRLGVEGCNTLHLADLLVRSGLWVEKEVGGEDGYVFHDWSDVNETRADVAKRRNATRKRVAAHRERKRAARRPEVDDAGNALQGSYSNALQPSYTPVTASPPSPLPHTPSPSTPPTGGLALDESTTARGGGPVGTAARSTAGGARGTRIAEDFQPRPEDVEWFRENCPALAGRGKELTDEFRDYWLAKAGAAATKVDWFRTWRNRMRDRQEREQNRQQDRATRTGQGGVGSPARSTTDERIAALDRFKGRPEQPQLGDE